MSNPRSPQSAGTPGGRPTAEQRRAAAAKARRNNLIFGIVGGVLILGVVVAAIVLLVVQPGRQQTALPALTSQPSASATPTPTPPPPVEPTEEETSAEPEEEETTASATPTETESSAEEEEDTAEPIQDNNLPTTDDLSWLRGADWIDDGSSEGLGDDPLSNCVSNDSASALGAEAMLRRNFTLPDTGYSTAVAMNFDTAEAAARAYAALGQLAQSCASTLSQGEFADVQPVESYEVPIPEGIEGRFYRTSYTLEQQDPAYETTGVAIAGNRVILLSMVVVVDDKMFAYSEDDESDDKPLHPMFGSLAKSAERLTY